MVLTASAPSKRLTADATRLRPGRPEDAEDAGRICYEAFRALAAAHNFSNGEVLRWALARGAYLPSILY